MRKKWKRVRQVKLEDIQTMAEYFKKYYKCVLQRGRPKDPTKALVPRLQEHFGVSRPTIMRALSGKKQIAKKSIVKTEAASLLKKEVPQKASSHLAAAFAVKGVWKESSPSVTMKDAELLQALKKALLDTTFAASSEGAMARVMCMKLQK